MPQKLKYYTVVFLLFLITTSLKLEAQTCCTGSAPITGSIKISTLQKKQFNFNLIFDHNNISDFYLDTEKVNEDYLSRITNTILLQTNYGITNRLNLSLVIPVINKSEQVVVNNIPTNGSTTSPGDISTMAQYLFVDKGLFQIVSGIGIKLPTGPTKLKDSNDQFILQPSLQPGTGSFDYIFLSRIQYSFSFRRSLSVGQTFTFQLTTASSNFANHESYEFGNEFQSFTTISDQFALGNLVNTPSLTLRVNIIANNQIEGFTDPNSGGFWLYVSPSWAVQITPSISTFIQADIPVYRNLNGFQIITSYKIIGGITYNL